MFSVKATYRNETRRFNFPDSNSFPTFEQLQNQLHRVFTLNDSHYLSKLLFSSDASKPSRILIAREVYTADGYNNCLIPYQGRSWPNALLKFDLVDGIVNGIGNVGLTNLSNRTVGQGPWGRTFSADTSSQLQTTPRPIPSFYMPPPPVTFSSSHTLHSDVRSVPLAYDSPPTTTTHKLQGCCSVAEAKIEIQTLLQTFQQDLNCILTRTFGSTPANQSTEQMDINAPPLSSGPTNTSFATFQSLPPDCSTCRKSVAGQWYTCNHCLALVCSDCNTYDRTGLCAVSLGRHTLRLAPFAATPLVNATHPSGTSWVPQPLPPVTRVSSSPSPPPPAVPFIPPSPAFTPNASFPPAQEPSYALQAPRSYSPSPTAACAPISFPPPPPPPVIHRSVICDMCETTIEGIRHKCLDCADYDLCTSCLSSGLSQPHNPRHKFLDLAEPTRIVVHTVNEAEVRPSRDSASFAPALPTPDIPVWHHATCDLCDSVIQGLRYKCVVCPDFDTCDSCFAITNEQHPNHSFVKLVRPDDYIMRRHSLRPHHSARCDVCDKPIEGIRFKCMHPDCPDFDLCERCEALPIPQHPDIHPMLKMKSVETAIPTVHRVMPIYPASSDRFQTPDFEEGYMRNPQVPFSWGTPPSRSRSSSLIAREPSPSLETPWLRRSYETVDWASNIARSQSTRSHEGNLSQFSPHHRPTSVQPNSPAINERSFSPSQWSAPVDYSLYALSSDALRRPQSIPWERSHSPIDVQPATEHATTIRRDHLSVTQELPPLEFDVSVRPSPKLPSKPVVSGFTDSDFSVPLVNPVGWFGEGLNNLVHHTTGHSAVTDSSHETQITETHSPPGSTTAESPLDNEALLGRPPISPNLFEMREITPLAELLNGYRSMSSLRLEEELADHNGVATPDNIEEPSSAGFIEHVTCPDGQIFAAGVTFIKVWRMANNGTRDWPVSTEVVFVGGAELATGNPHPHLQHMVTIGPLKPGEQKNIWTGELRAPDAPGKYTSYWSLRDDQGQLFGESIWVDIEVVNPSYYDTDESLNSSSLIVMPDPTLPQAPSSDGMVSRSPTLRTDDDALSDSSSVSLVSVPSSEDEEDTALWAASRAQATSHSVAEHTSQATDYVLMYDDDTSEEE
ncbi:hypothetical protein D9615_001201 [Tricholomella constricta]|uniref:ZZ-type domain-containing protein n=1 Tax=Tricholomella constricta TaxID=117010 RepID=A0A8H5HLR3_9AGAR|nr:hypothetical protein D9615_001201 [Tricholomella constricta]